MLVYEFHFNPKPKGKLWLRREKEKEVIYDSFCYEPENEQEKKLGSLYIVAEIRDNAVNNTQLLNNLASLIKQEYYTGVLELPEKKLKKALEKANKFLINEAGEKEDIDFLKKLNLIIFSLSSSQFENGQEWQINLAKKGNLKVLFSREKEIVDIGQNLEIKKGSPQPMFEKITSGRLLKDDKIMVFTEQVFDFFENNNLIEKISALSKKREIKKIFKERKKALSEISGIFLLIILKTNLKKKSKFLSYLTNIAIARKVKSKLYRGSVSVLSKPSEPVLFRPPKLSIFSIISKYWLLLKRFIDSITKNFRAMIALLLALPKKIQALPQKISESLDKLKIKTKSVIFSKKFIIILLLVLILAIGYLIFKSEKEVEIQTANQSLEEIKAKVEQAENFLIFKEEAKANLLFQSAWKDTLPLTETTFLLKDQAQDLKESIEEQLYPLNKIEEIKEPLLSNDFEETDFNAEEIIYRSKVYSLNPEAGEIIKEGKIWGKSEKLIDARAMAIDGSIWVINKENKIDRYYLGKYQDTLELNIFPEAEKPEKIYISPALSYIYLLEPEKKRVIIIDKAGNIIKQFQSEKFDNLKGFIVSENGKTIWLLNNSKVYQINL